MSRTISQNAPNIAAGPSTLDRLGRRVVLGLLCTMVGLAAAGTGGAFLLKPGAAQAGRPVAETLRAAANYARLPAMIFTLADGDRLRELRVRVVLDMDPTAPAKTVEEMSRVIVNDYVDATLCGLFIAVVVAMVIFGILWIRRASAEPRATAHEITGPVAPARSGGVGHA